MKNRSHWITPAIQTALFWSRCAVSCSRSVHKNDVSRTVALKDVYPKRGLASTALAPEGELPLLIIIFELVYFRDEGANSVSEHSGDVGSE